MMVRTGLIWLMRGTCRGFWTSRFHKMQECTYSSVAEKTLPSQTELCYVDVVILRHCTSALLETDCLTVAGFVVLQNSV